MLRHVRLRRPVLFAGGLVLSALLAAPAVAQRRTEAHVGLSHRTDRGHIEVSIGRGGVQVSAGRHNHRRPVVQPCPQPAGHWETRCERVWVPGPVRKVWVPPLYETRFDHCGRPYQVEVRCGYWDTIQEQGCWETRESRVWVPAPVHYHDGRRWR
jgi:hypothetical protein